jgi:hypothetical protein
MTKREFQDWEGQFLERLPIRTIVHLTFPRAVTEVDRDNAFRLWVDRIQEQHRCTIAYVRGDEAKPYRLAARGVRLDS